jgi:glycosyltransferase involved in cell wall biosynthesis
MEQDMSGTLNFFSSDLAVVIPALNEERTIRSVVSGALQHSRTVIVVDDGSSDGTAKALCGMPVTLVRHERTLGKAAALRLGFTVALARHCAGVITLDADGQHKPEDLPVLMRTAVSQPDSIVIAARKGNLQAQPKARRFANRVADFWISWAAGRVIEDTQSGMRYYPAGVAHLAQSLRGEGFAFESEVLIAASLDLGTPVVTVPIDARYEPDARRSHFRPVRDVAAIVRAVARPLLGRGQLWQRWLRSRHTDNVPHPPQLAQNARAF